jgi:hypothetical protein
VGAHASADSTACESRRRATTVSKGTFFRHAQVQVDVADRQRTRDARPADEDEVARHRQGCQPVPLRAQHLARDGSEFLGPS